MSSSEELAVVPAFLLHGAGRREKNRARGAATGKRGVEDAYMARARAGRKRRRLVAGEEAEVPPSPGAAPAAPAPPADHEAAPPPSPRPPAHRALRPYRAAVPYARQRLQHQTLLGRQPVGARPICPTSSARSPPRTSLG